MSDNVISIFKITKKERQRLLDEVDAVYGYLEFNPNHIGADGKIDFYPAKLRKAMAKYGSIDGTERKKR